MARIPHFYNGFYVYQYSMGIAAASSLLEDIQAGDKDSLDAYLSFLNAGSSATPDVLLKNAGVDVTYGDYAAAD